MTEKIHFDQTDFERCGATLPVPPDRSLTRNLQLRPARFRVVLKSTIYDRWSKIRDEHPWPELIDDHRPFDIPWWEQDELEPKDRFDHDPELEGVN